MSAAGAISSAATMQEGQRQPECAANNARELGKFEVILQRRFGHRDFEAL